MIQEPFSYGQLERTGFSFDPSNPFVPIPSKLKNSSEIKVCLTLGQQLMTLRFCRRLVIRFSCLHHLQEAGHLLPTHPDLILTFQNVTSNTNIAQVKKSLLLILIRPDGSQIISHDA